MGIKHPLGFFFFFFGVEITKITSEYFLSGVLIFTSFVDFLLHFCCANRLIRWTNKYFKLSFTLQLAY